MARKEVSELAGIGDVLGARLAANGFTAADMVYGQFLILGRDKERFNEWLFQMCQANAKQQKDCFNCLSEWDRQFFK